MQNEKKLLQIRGRMINPEHIESINFDYDPQTQKVVSQHCIVTMASGHEFEYNGLEAHAIYNWFTGDAASVLRALAGSVTPIDVRRPA